MTDAPARDSVRISHGDLWRGGRLVLRGATLEIPFPAVVGLIGATGAGKSTLLHSIAHVLGPADRVRLTLAGLPHRTMALVPHTPALPGWLSVDEALTLAKAGPSVASVTDALEIDCLRGRRLSGLSNGQRHAVALAAALSSGEGILLLDEPFSHLELRSRSCLSRWIRDVSHGGAGAVTFVASRSPEDIADLCDWIVSIRHGEYSFCGPITALHSRYAHPRDRAAPLERRILELI